MWAKNKFVSIYGSVLVPQIRCMSDNFTNMQFKKPWKILFFENTNTVILYTLVQV